MTAQTDNPVREPVSIPAAETQTAEVEAPIAGQVAEQPEGQAPETEPVDPLEAELAGQQNATEHEIEYEGKKYKVAPELREAFLRQADYTRKTQEVAEGRKSLETRERTFNELRQAADKTIAQRSNVAAIDMELAKYANLDWMKLASDDPPRAQQLDLYIRQLQGKRGQLVGEIQQTEQQFVQTQRQEVAKRQADTRRAVEHTIPGWNADGDEKMVAGAAKFYGYSPEMLAPAAADPVLYRILWDATQYRAAQERIANRKPTSPSPTVPAVPAAKVPAKATSGKAGVHDGLSPDEWMKRRNAEVAAKRK